MLKPGLLTNSLAIKQSFLPVYPQLQLFFSAWFSSSCCETKVGYVVEDVNLCSIQMLDLAEVLSLRVCEMGTTLFPWCRVFIT